jgi:hypothetical protein
MDWCVKIVAGNGLDFDGHFGIWEWVKSLEVPLVKTRQNCWDLGMFFPMKNGIYRLIGIDPWPQMELLKL